MLPPLAFRRRPAGDKPASVGELAPAVLGSRMKRFFLHAIFSKNTPLSRRMGGPKGGVVSLLFFIQKRKFVVEKFVGLLLFV
jgi:hypothetical protein